MPNLVEIGQNAAEIWRFFDFQDAAVRHLGFVVCVRTIHEGHFGGLHRCAKFGWNRCSSFDNMHVFRFHEFGLKTPIHAPKMGFFGGFDPLNEGLSHRDPQKALMVAETRRMSH